MPNVFGTTYPVAISDFGGENEVRIEFLYGNITKSEPKTEYVEQESKLTGIKEFHGRGCHWTVEIQYNLFKEVDPPLFYRTLMGVKGKNDFFLQLHADGPFFLHAADENAYFCLTQVAFVLLSPADSRYGLVATFESAETIYMSFESFPITP